jgi:hypothetical protein
VPLVRVRAYGVRVPTWLRHESVRHEVDAPDGRAWRVVCFRTGTGPPRGAAPWFVTFKTIPLLGPVAVVVNRLIFLGRWTVLVGCDSSQPWWTARRSNKLEAEQLAGTLADCIVSGRWKPDLEPIPADL